MGKCPPDCEGCWADEFWAEVDRWDQLNLPEPPNSRTERLKGRYDLKCSICPPNRGENHKGPRPRTDRYKNKRK